VKWFLWHGNVFRARQAVALSTSFVESAVNQAISGKRHVRLCTERCHARTYTAP
jgi:hypothetical protein